VKLKFNKYNLIMGVLLAVTSAVILGYFGISEFMPNFLIGCAIGLLFPFLEVSSA
jgi:hypothetical protein